jgi:hypothetical protein
MKAPAKQEDTSSARPWSGLYFKMARPEVMFLCGEGRARFVQALLNPPAPNSALRRAAQRDRKMLERKDTYSDVKKSTATGFSNME